MYCKGKGKIFVNQCPRSCEDSSLLPYFIAYRNSNGLIWPDGRGRLYQPIKLVHAFDILTYYFSKLEGQKIEQVRDNAKKNRSPIKPSR